MLEHVPKTSRIGCDSRPTAADSPVAERSWDAPTGGIALSHRVGRGEGHAESAIAQQLGTNRKTVALWCKRFAEQGPKSLWQIAPGRGRKPTYGPEKIKALMDATLQTKPAGMTHWSCRLMAKAQGVSKSTVSNIWRSHQVNRIG